MKRASTIDKVALGKRIKDERISQKLTREKLAELVGLSETFIKTLENEPKYDELFIPDSMLRDGEDIFLDNITLCELKEKLGMEITPVPNDGYVFIEKILGINLEF